MTDMIDEKENLPMLEVLRKRVETESPLVDILVQRTGRTKETVLRWIRGIQKPIAFDWVVVLFTLEEAGYAPAELRALPKEFITFGRMLKDAGSRNAMKKAKQVLALSPFRIAEFFRKPQLILDRHCARVLATQRSDDVDHDAPLSRVHVSEEKRERGEQWKDSVIESFIHTLAAIQSLAGCLLSETFSDDERAALRERSVKNGSSIFSISDQLRGLLSREAHRRFHESKTTNQTNNGKD